ncbi:hypothetical protein G4Y73_00840 [Wenzhouxiangella sp. XN201]|uniref:hypothetical protein n=1 Tax=Wenzhouxiangella sp. XN201 TaxID=2710755 RepID=UPI0013CA46F6|nr:hypothetical protein [Wenzhouxiangella sp. XN201]NEZ02691.1 hypothetical protein [Wenzhouxiangella sp. XN201]
MRYLFQAGTLVSFLLLATLGQAALPGGISGHWYNPEQSGHGLTITLARPGFAAIIWHVYDDEGNPLTLNIEGRISGRSITGTAYAARGMEFGSFDPAALEVSVWGEVDLEFDSCVQATLHWDSPDPAFGSGSMPLERLAFTHGVDCNLPPIDQSAFGRYGGEVIEGDDPETAVAFTGIVDLEGRLWGIERLRYPIPSPMWAGGRVHHVVRTEPAREDGSLRGRADLVFWTLGGREGSDAPGSWPEGEPGGELSWQSRDRDFDLSFSPANDDRTLVAPIDTAALAGRWAVPMQNQFGEATAWLEIEAGGRACIEMSPWYEPPGGCHFEGRIDAPDGEHGLIDFEFHRPEESPGTPHRGRGWLTDGPDGLELILTGDGSFGLMAYPES